MLTWLAWDPHGSNFYFPVLFGHRRGTSGCRSMPGCKPGFRTRLLSSCWYMVVAQGYLLSMLCCDVQPGTYANLQWNLSHFYILWYECRFSIRQQRISTRTTTLKKRPLKRHQTTVYRQNSRNYIPDIIIWSYTCLTDREPVTTHRSKLSGVEIQSLPLFPRYECLAMVGNSITTLRFDLLLMPLWVSIAPL